MVHSGFQAGRRLYYEFDTLAMTYQLVLQRSFKR